jgi:hypothetical protein
MPICTRFFGWQFGAMGVVGALVRRPEPRRGVHPLIHILFLDIDMAVDMDDADIAVDMRSDAAHIGEAQAVVAAADDRKHARGKDMGNRLGDLVEGLFDVAGDDENVAGIAQVEFLVDVDAAVEPVAVIERRDAPHRLRSKARSGPISGRRIERRADKGRLEVADLADVLAIGGLHEGIDAGKGRLMAAAEQRDVAVDHRTGGFESELKRPLDLLALLVLRDARQRLHGLGAVRVFPTDPMGAMGVNVIATGSMRVTTTFGAASHAK